MKRKKPSFNESYYGFRTFSHLLEDAQRRGIVNLRRDQKSGSYIIEDLGPAAPTDAATAGDDRGRDRLAERPLRPPERGRRRCEDARPADAAGAAAGARGRRPTTAEAGAGATGRRRRRRDRGGSASTRPAAPREGEPRRRRRAGPGPRFSLFSWLRRDEGTAARPTRSRSGPEPRPGEALWPQAAGRVRTTSDAAVVERSRRASRRCDGRGPARGRRSRLRRTPAGREACPRRTLTRTPSASAPAWMARGAVLPPARERTSSAIARSATRRSAASAGTVSAVGSSSDGHLGGAQLGEQVLEVDGCPAGSPRG